MREKKKEKKFFKEREKKNNFYFSLLAGLGEALSSFVFHSFNHFFLSLPRDFLAYFDDL